MGKLIYLDDYRFSYREVLSVDHGSSSLQAFVNDATGEVEVVQANAEGEAITTVLTAADLARMLTALTPPAGVSK
jgi:hypothetical protein